MGSRKIPQETCSERGEQMMKTKAVRLYGKNDLRLEEFELPQIKDNEILASVISDSICMSTYKAAHQGKEHKRIPQDIDVNPVIVGHEFSGNILEVGKKWQHLFAPGDRYAIQPALNYKGSLYAPGYSYPYIGGDATYIVIPNEVMETGSLFKYTGDSYFGASLTEPVSCVIAAYRENFHNKENEHEHIMGIKDRGACAFFAAAGPMGLAAIDYGIHGPMHPRLMVVTDIDAARLKRAQDLITVEDARAHGVELIYLNTSNMSNPVQYLKDLNGGELYDDIFVYAPVSALIEQGDQLLAKGGCLNFFAGPTSTDFSAKLNFYDVHYSGHRITGTSGGNTTDMKEALSLSAINKINTAIMVSHIGGLDSVIETTMNLPHIKGAKKLIYTHISLPLTALSDFEELGKTNPFFKDLSDICARHQGLWSTEAEQYVLKNGKKI
jgi:L-sorbose 1-phosphate reductase